MSKLVMHKSYAQIIFPSSFADKGGLNKDAAMPAWS